MTPPPLPSDVLAGRCRIAPSSGTAFRLRAGDRLRVTDPEGEQVSDLMAFADGDPDEWLSSGRTFDYEETIRITTGNALWSNRSRRMLTVVADTCGVHDFLLTACSPEMYTLLYGLPEDHEHPSCLTNLALHLGPFGMGRDRVPTTFNLFMNVPVQPDGRISVETPTSRPGDFIEFRAEMDLVVGLTACAAEGTNNGRLKPIDYEVFPAAPAR
ncbi:MAG TPA: urea carboxylase-associated family protein [Rubricoccaceae bacterium]